MKARLLPNQIWPRAVHTARGWMTRKLSVIRKLVLLHNFCSAFVTGAGHLNWHLLHVKKLRKVPPDERTCGFEGVFCICQRSVMCALARWYIKHPSFFPYKIYSLSPFPYPLHRVKNVPNLSRGNVPDYKFREPRLEDTPEVWIHLFRARQLQTIRFCNLRLYILWTALWKGLIFN